MRLQPDSAARAMTNDECPMDHSRRSLSGFTTTEVIVVMVLAGILAFSMIPRFVSVRRESPSFRANMEIRAELTTAIDRYQVEVGSYPHALQDLVAQPAGVTNWGGPYADEILRDPWGNSYVYVFPGHHNTNGYDLYSKGRDGKAGTADDIGNWTK
jgi:general secretion pathway protein G